MTPAQFLHPMAIAIVLSVGALPRTVSAEESTSAMAAPKCDLEQIQKLCAENPNECVKAEKGAFEGGYNVTTKDKDAENKFLTEVVIKHCM